VAIKKNTSNVGASAQQKLFAYAYFSNKGNGTQAAITAGYSKKTAAEQATRLLRNVKVQKIISGLTAKIEAKAIVTKEEVLQELRKIALFDLRTLYDQNGALKPIAELSDEAGAAITGIEVDEIYEFIGGVKANVGQTKKIKMNSKIAALESICKVLGYIAATKTTLTVTKVGLDAIEETYE